MEPLAIVGGIGLIVLAFVDLLNTLVSTSTSNHRYWPTNIVGVRLFALVRMVAVRMKATSTVRERLLSVFAPVMLLVLLAMWVTLQVVGFGLIWWGMGGVDGVLSLGDNIYYSGVVFFTVGFGEVLPSGALPRAGAILEAFFGVVTTALVIGYLPSLYAAYSDRERSLMTLDDGSDDRITPTALVLAWAPDADTDRLNARFSEWERWASGVLETHSTLPLLRLFRSHDSRQNWVTALGLLSDAAIHAQIIVGSSGRTESYWFLRRSIALFEAMTENADLSRYDHVIARHDDPAADSELFIQLYAQLEAHGFELLPYDEARVRAAEIRNRWAPHMEYLIDALLCPRGFWSPYIGLELSGD
jgi:hypothetical protein